MQSFSAELLDRIQLLPEKPGVYIMRDASGTVIYVGKAKNLKNRVRQYFKERNALEGYERKVAAMVESIADFEYVITESETEALTLESNLIKRHMPRYNILLKDDKHFPYVRVDIKNDFPTFSVVRKVKNDGAKYFGPYLSGLFLRDAMTAIRECFPVRHCKKDIKKAIARRERPCLMFHINKCCAPCSGSVTREQYHDIVNKVCAFLSGDSAGICALLTDKMNAAAERYDYEAAAVFRDRMRAVTALSSKQRAIAAKTDRYDVFAIAEGDGEANVTSAVCYALFVHEGKVIDNAHFSLDTMAESKSEIMASFLKQFYAEAADIPHELLIDCELEGSAAMEAWFSKLCKHSVHIICPKRGEKRKLVQMAEENALATQKRQSDLTVKAWERTEGALIALSNAIGMEFLPSRIECYDNSHLQGRDTVGACIVFTDGKPDNKQYRRFRIKSETGGDDYAAMKEMLTRRFERAANGDEKFMQLPDLIIADGGRGQLNVVLEVLHDFGAEHIAAVGLAEKNEELVLPDCEEHLILPSHSPELHLVQRIRDEAHRFAITYHRSLRTKSALYSQLDSVPGIGEKRKRALFDAFLTIDAIKSASIEQLCAVSTVNRPAAEAVYSYFHKE